MHALTENEYILFLPTFITASEKKIMVQFRTKRSAGNMTIHHFQRRKITTGQSARIISNNNVTDFYFEAQKAVLKLIAQDHRIILYISPTNPRVDEMVALAKIPTARWRESAPVISTGWPNDATARGGGKNGPMGANAKNMMATDMVIK